MKLFDAEFYNLSLRAQVILVRDRMRDPSRPTLDTDEAPGFYQWTKTNAKRLIPVGSEFGDVFNS